jgi:hypothetical protein
VRNGEKVALEHAIHRAIQRNPHRVIGLSAPRR